MKVIFRKGIGYLYFKPNNNICLSMRELNDIIKNYVNTLPNIIIDKIRKSNHVLTVKCYINNKYKCFPELDIIIF
jgi:hypothetical protein